MFWITRSTHSNPEGEELPSSACRLGRKKCSGAQLRAAPGAAEVAEGAEATLAPARAVEGAAPGHEAGAGAGGTEEERSEVS